MKKIYLDNAATTQLDPRVLKQMMPFFEKKYGNASSLHVFGREAKEALDKSRDEVANFLGCRSNEIVFTSGGTESNNLAIIGSAIANRASGDMRASRGHIITTEIEHHAVLNTCKWLNKYGFDVDYLDVDKQGIVDADDLEETMRKDTVLVSVVHANNEIGTVQDIEKLGKICHEHGALFHTDAVQSFGKIPINLKHIDLLSASGHKIYGPKGVGLLYVKNGIKIESLNHGGGQEADKRSGTENIPGIVGFAEAAIICKKEMKQEAKREVDLRDFLIKNVLKIDNSWLNGHVKQRLPGNANFGFRFIEGEALVMLLDDEGIACSTGSACSSKSLEPSHVLMALGLKHKEAHGSLRVSIGRFNTKDEIKQLCDVLPGCVAKLRKISPFKR